jgi:hypothetical protein
MKRLVWLLLIVFGTALAQVSPVDVGVQNQKVCSCCDAPGACGMPDCGLPPSSAPAGFIAEQPAPAARLAARRNAARAYRIATSLFIFQGAAKSVLTAVTSTNRLSTAAQLPLFKAHCSFVI